MAIPTPHTEVFLSMQKSLAGKSDRLNICRLSGTVVILGSLPLSTKDKYKKARLGENSTRRRGDENEDEKIRD